MKKKIKKKLKNFKKLKFHSGILHLVRIKKNGAN